jgi:hypothetical protein
MSGLTRPGFVAAILTVLALSLHPDLGFARWLPERAMVVAAAMVLAATALAARAAGAATASRLRDGLVAAAAVSLAVAGGLDGLRGHEGVVTLSAGQARSDFDETGLGGRSLGLRPFGFTVGAAAVDSDGRTRLVFDGQREAELATNRAVAFGGFRFAQPREAPTGQVARLRVAVSDERGETQVADVAPGVPVEVQGMTLALEQYFPDFALDENQRPFSRSLEPRNPAALIDVEKDGRSYRAFVIQSMPGIHHVEGLGRAFSLLEVEPERSAEIAVHREPGMPLALLSGLLLAAGLAVGTARGWRTGEPEARPDDRVGRLTPLAAGIGTLALLLLATRGTVLAWRFTVAADEGAFLFRGVGPILGLAFLAALAGVLLLLAQCLAGGESGVRTAAVGSLWLAVGLGVLAALVAGIQVTRLPAGASLEAAAAPAGLAVAFLLLAASLWVDGSRGKGPAKRPRFLAAATLLVALGTLLAAVVGVLHAGTYATPEATRWASSTLLGLAALEATALPGLRLVLFLVSSLGLAARVS